MVHCPRVFPSPARGTPATGLDLQGCPQDGDSSRATGRPGKSITVINYAIVIETHRMGELWKGTIRSLYESEVEAEVAFNELDDDLRKKAHLVRLHGDGWEVGETVQDAMQNPKPGTYIEYLI